MLLQHLGQLAQRAGSLHAQVKQEFASITARRHFWDRFFNSDRLAQTLVFYMGLTQAEEIQRQLLQHGMRHDMPVSLVENSTSTRQRVVTVTLTQLAALARHVSSPSLMIHWQRGESARQAELVFNAGLADKRKWRAISPPSVCSRRRYGMATNPTAS